VPSLLKSIGVAIFGLYLGFSVARGAMQVLEPAAPVPVPCYDLLDASANVIVLFNKCTGEIELRIIESKPPPAPPAVAPKVGI
jgi:hypothetical protein